MQRSPVTPPFEVVSRVHRTLGHPIRTSSNGRQAYCVVCYLLWSTSGDWYATDLIETLATA